jgi:hypothetical protein
MANFQNGYVPLSVSWHPKANVVSYTSDGGQLFTATAPIPLNKPLPYGGAVMPLGEAAAEEPEAEVVQMI